MKSAQLFIVTLSLIWPSSQINSTKEKEDCFEWGVEYHGGGLDNPMVTGVTSPDSCQSLCQERPGCNYFAWVNSEHEVTGYRNTCWLKSSPGTAQSCSTCVSGPRECEGDTECCTVVTVSSSGDTGDYQWNRLGVFLYQYDAPDGRPVYFKEKDSQWLYFVQYPYVWYVNDDPLVNMGGIINMESDAMCPEDIQTPWSFYRWGDGEVNDWEEDPFLKVTCGGELPKTTTSTTSVKTTSTTTERPGPPPEPCTWGSGCDGCEVTTEAGGEVYCCASQCDSGEVWVWAEDGVTQCNCSH